MTRTFLAIAVLTLLGLAVRLYGIGWGLPGTYEEAYPLKVAWTMWGWGPDLGFDPNPHFFRYPSLTIYLQFLGQLLLLAILRLVGSTGSVLDFQAIYCIDPTPFYWMGRALTALFGAATVVPTYLLAARVAGPWAAFGAALLVAVNVPLVSKSQVIEVDVPLTAFVTLALLLAVRLLERTTRRAAAWAGVAVGLATATKYPGLFALLPVVAGVLLATRARAKPAGTRRVAAKAPRSRTRAAGRKRDALEPARPGWVAMVLAVVAGVILAVLVASPFLVLDARAFWRDFLAERQHMEAGHFGAVAGSSWLYYASTWVGGIAGWPLGLAAALGLVGLAGWRRQHWALILAGFIVPYFLVVGSWSMKTDRYLLPLVPAGAVLACAWVEHLGKRFPAGPRKVLHGAALALFALPNLAQLPNHLQRLRPDSRTQAKQWIEAHLPPGSFILSEFYGPDLMAPTGLAPYGTELREALCHRLGKTPLFAVQTLPMFQVAPERSGIYYDPNILSLADYVVVTTSVRDRYRTDPDRFSRQLAFYDTLNRSLPKLIELTASGSGPGITIHRNPSHRRAFAARPAVDSIPRLASRPGGRGAEAFYYYNLGLNLEAFGFPQTAIAAYREGMSFAEFDRRTLIEATKGIVRCLVRTGHQEAAFTLLDQECGLRRSRAEIDMLQSVRREAASGAMVRPWPCP